MRNFKSKAAMLTLVFVLGLLFNNINTNVFASNEIVSIVNDMDTEGETNKFTYYGEGWGSGATSESITGDEHYNDVDENAEDAATKYYTIDFIGNKIEVYGHKNWNHGIMSYSIDGGEPVEVSSYGGNRVGNQLLFTAENLEEGAHKLTVVATGKTESPRGKAVIQVDYAKVYHERYQIDDIVIANEEIILMEGATENIEYTVLPAYAVVEDLVFASKDTNVVTVDENGTIKAVGEGNTTITVESEKDNIIKEINVTVNKAVKGMHASIVDTNSHYTTEQYNKVLNMGKLSEDLFSWKADKTLSEIAIISKGSSLQNVTITTSDFVNGENILESSNVKTTFLKETLAYTGHNGYHNGDLTIPEGNREPSPEILYTSEPVDIGFNKVQPVWVEFNIPEDTEAGIYTGTISVTADEIEEAIVFTYNLEVLDATMPDSMDYAFDFEAWQYPYSSAEYYNLEPFSEEHFEVLKPQMLKYKELGGHAITASIVEEAWGGQTYSANEIRYPSMIKWTKTTKNTYEFDFTIFDKWIQFNKDLGIGDKIICYSMIPWGDKIIYFDEATGRTANMILTPGTNNYQEVWTQFLVALTAHLDEKGWFEETYIGIDERANMNLAFDVIDKVKNKDGKSLKKAGAMDHFSSGYEHITDRVDDISVGSIAAKGALNDYKEFVKERNESSENYKTTIYTCTGHFPNSFSLSMPGESYWTMMFTAAQGATGYMRWAYDAWVEDPLNDVTHWAFESGDTALIYPDHKDAENPMYKSSVRLEKMAEGMRDVNKLEMMKAEIPQLSNRIEALYDSVVVDYAGRKNGLGSFGGAEYATDETRERLPVDMAAIREEIKEITKQYIELKEGSVTEVSSVELDVEELTLELGKNKVLNVTILPTNTINLDVNWESSNNQVVTVNKKGLVEAVGIGEATIKVTSTYNEEAFDEVVVTVVEKDLSGSQIAYYDFENITGNVVSDKWNSYDGILEGAEIVDGMVGDALQFNKNSDNVTIESPATLDKDWTLAMWVKKGDIKSLPASIMWDGNNFTSGDAGSESIDIQRDSEGNLGVHVKPGFLTVKHVVPEEEWVHLAWVNDKSTGLTVYVDGKSTGTNAWTVNNDFTAPLKVIGGRNYIGAIDEVKVYDMPLNQAEVNELRKLPGLNVNSTDVEVMIDGTYQIEAELVGNYEDKTITFESRNEEVATVTENGLITGVSYGDTEVVVHNAETGFTKVIKVRVNKELNIGYSIPQYNYPKEDQIVIDRERGQYLGQPDMIALKDDTLLTVYPKGHGLGTALLKKSTDGGLTWSDRIVPNETWENSMETPTIYRLDMVDGSTKVIEISGGPGWGNGFRGWTTSISDDNGETWSDFKEWHEGSTSIVAMASLVQLKDENGNFIDKWMGVYHDYGYVNYKTYLTFDEDGNEQWSKPEPYLSEYRDMESEYQICEVGMFRSPDGERIVALARSQSHMNLSTMFYSDDEGETWSKPREMQGALLGERHKVTYDPISGRLLITFREIILDYDKDGQIEGNDWIAGDWIAWVGTYEDLMNGEEGQYRIRVAEDFTPSTKSGDTGYAGNVALSDGTFVLNSYGCFDENDPYNNDSNTYKTYIIGVRFKLAEIDAALGLIDKSELEAKVAEVEGLVAGDYTEESFAAFEEVLNLAKKAIETDEYQQIEIDKILEDLINAIENLEESSEKSADYNKDGVVDILDLAIASKHHGKNSVDNADEWNELSRFDLNNDNIIDSYEINYIMNEILNN